MRLGAATIYVRHVSAALDGSLTPRQIRGEISKAQGLQLQAQWLREKGFDIREAK